MQIVELAKKVAGELKKYEAKFSLFPKTTLSEGEDWAISVMPLGVERTDTFPFTVRRIQVTVISKLQHLDDIEYRLHFVERLGQELLGLVVGNLQCTCISYDPIYFPDEAEEYNQFRSVLELTFCGLHND